MFKKMLCTRGQAIVEFTIVLPIFLLLVFGMIQFGLVFHDYLTVSEVAREGARIAAVGGNVRTEDFSAKISGGNIIFKLPSSITSTPATVVVGGVNYDAVTVQVIAQPTGWSMPIVAAFLPSQLQGTVTMRLE